MVSGVQKLYARKWICDYFSDIEGSVKAKLKLPTEVFGVVQAQGRALQHLTGCSFVHAARSYEGHIRKPFLEASCFCCHVSCAVPCRRELDFWLPWKFMLLANTQQKRVAGCESALVCYFYHSMKSFDMYSFVAYQHLYSVQLPLSLALS